jgi:hypothetical protein
MDQPVSLWKSSLTYGLYLGLALVLVSAVYYVTGHPFAKSASYVSYGIMIIGIVLAQLNYRKSLGGLMSYGQAVGIGLLTLVFASVITGFFTYLLHSVIDPSLQDQLRLNIEEQLVKQGNVPEEQLEMAINMATKFQKPAIMFVMNIFNGAFMGLLISLISSIFTQKKPAEEFSE